MPFSFSTTLRIQTLATGFLALVVAGALLTAPVTPERARLAASSTAAQHVFRQVTSTAQFAAGINQGTSTSGGSLRLASPQGQVRAAGVTWSWARWTSAWVNPGLRFTQLIPSWNVETPANTAILVQARVRTATKIGTFKTVATWSSRDRVLRRQSGATQAGPIVRLDTDTLRATNGAVFTGYQLRVLTLRTPSSTATPVVENIQAVASLPASGARPTSTPLFGAQELAVPRYSQMIHRGEYPRWGGGGEAWCSPTALSMILGYYGRLPATSSYAWVNKSYADPWVDHVARVVFDYAYDGAGNWPFNTGYAAQLAGGAFVTRLPTLRQAERFIRAGIPLAASISFGSGGLSGAPISSTAGHLVVIRGFTASGDVIVNDPAAATNATVRRVYDRAQFERAWQTKSKGTVYVVRTAATPLPARAGNRSW